MPHAMRTELAGGQNAESAALSHPNPLLELSGIGKSFGAVRALDGMDLAIGPAEVVGLMGDNGAGKSTLTKVIAGNFRPSQGEIRLEGAPVAFDRPADARNAGI